MEPKPPGWSAEHAAAFSFASAAEQYRHRPPYPAELFGLLARLAGGGPVLDAGCGPGDLARPLAVLVERVDAVDVSEPMLAAGRAAAGGDAANLRWVAGPVEATPLDPPYALVVAGDSVHWFDWGTALPRFAAALGEEGMLAVVQRDADLGAAHELLTPVFARHGSRDFLPLDPVDELERRGLFARAGREAVGPLPWRPTAGELLGFFHSMSGFVVERLEDPAAFDREAGEAIATIPAGADGRLELAATTTVIWGRPAPG